MLKLRGNRVGVEVLKKQDRQKGFMVMPDETNAGIIRYVGEKAAADLKVGQKVYFTNEYQKTSMGGIEIIVMTDENVVAVVEDELKEAIAKT